MILLKLSGIRGGYSEVDIIHGIDLEVKAGEIVTIAGTNGAGKSTLVKALLGLLPRVEGAIALDGKDLSKLAAEDRFYAGLAYVPQVANVFGSLTVRENLQVVRGVKNMQARMQNVLEAFPALTEKLSQRAGNLSGGERQQLAFARALMPSPKLMVLDEPTAGVDVDLRRSLWDFISRLNREGHTILLTTHYLEEAETLCNRIAMLKRGRIVALDTTQNLLARTGGNLEDAFVQIMHSDATNAEVTA